MTAAGYNVTLNSFPFVFVPPSTLLQLTPVNATYETGAFTGSGSGTVDRHRRADRHQPRPAARQHERLRRRVHRGCRRRPDRRRIRPGPTTSPASRPATIALIQRGACSFALKAHNAQAAGACGRHHLQPGRHVAARRPHRRQPPRSRRVGARPAHHPGRRRVVRRRRGACAAGLDRAHRRPAGRRTSRSTTCSPESKSGDPEQRRDGRRPPRLRHRRTRASTTTAPARPRSSRPPSSWPRSSRATSSASRGGAPRRPASSAPPPTSTA